MEKRIFLDLKVGGKGVLVPPENNAGGDRFDIHGRGLDDLAVVRGIFDHFLVEHLVFAPAGDRVKLIEMIGVSLHMKIALDELGVVAILHAGLEIFANKELK